MLVLWSWTSTGWLVFDAGCKRVRISGFSVVRGISASFYQSTQIHPSMAVFGVLEVAYSLGVAFALDVPYGMIEKGRA